MPGLWSAHRKAKLNLNAVPVAQPVGTLIPSIDQSADTLHDKTGSQPEEPAEPGSSTTTLAVASPGPPLADSRPPPSKRRLRTSRTGEESSKRTKVSGSNTSAQKSYASPSTRLSDLGGVEECVEKMLELVAMPLCHPEIYLHTGVQPPRGVLLHGPPGCGKTLLANAIAGVSMSSSTHNSCVEAERLCVGTRCTFYQHFCTIYCLGDVRGVGEDPARYLRGSQSMLRRFIYGSSVLCLVLQNTAPCLLFIDEIDAITPKRESAQREMERRIVAQFLTCMDGGYFYTSPL